MELRPGLALCANRGVKIFLKDLWRDPAADIVTPGEDMNPDTPSSPPLDPLEEAIFNAARDLAIPASREAFLDRACGADHQMRGRLDALLKAESFADRFFAKDPLELTEQCEPQGLSVTTSTLDESAHLEKPGTRIGRYKLLEKIGEGGCGVVYMAEQEEPVRRKVALKIIKAGMDSRQVIARFEAERQALAMMDHPNIAKFFDAGTIQTQSGEGRMQNPSADSPLHTLHSPLGSLPYFVMELVRGVRLTDYCIQKKLPIKQRLDLFVQVCHAVQHAHQKGIIHRDLKPSNILVTENDGKPVPKVIDFGIAKATEGQLTDKTIFTQFAAFMGTPAYMSPEQAAMTSLDIDTRSDIYSLGVLLYELLTGTTPFDAQELLKAGFDEMRRVIRETEPEKPSTRLTQRLRRGLESPPITPHSSLATDLDWIVMKCLEKDRSRRYETANALADDLHCYLRDEAISARPPSTMYRFRKIIRRNRWAWASAGAVALSLVVGIVLATGQAARAGRESRRALAAEAKAKTEAANSEQVARFLARMLEGVGPSVALGRDTTLLKEILAKTENRMAEDLAAQPEAEARLCVSLAGVYFDLDDLPKAESMASRVLELRAKLNEGEHAAAREALQHLGDIYGRRGDHVRAETMHREGLALLRKHGLGGGKTEALQLNSLANAVSGRGDPAGAERLYREGLELLRRRDGGNRIMPTLLMNLAIIRDDRGDHIEAERLGREAIELQRKEFGVEHPDLAIALSNLANALKSQGRLEEASKLSREAVSMLRKLMGQGNSRQITVMESLAFILQAKGDISEAEDLIREVLIIRRQGSHNDGGLAKTLSKLASIFIQRGQLAEAEVHARESQELWRRVGGADQMKWQDEIVRIGVFIRERDRREEALRLFEGLRVLQRNLVGPDSLEEAKTLVELSALALKQGGDTIAGERYAREAVTIRRKFLDPYHQDVFVAMNNLGCALQYQGRFAEAESVFRDCLATTKRNNSSNPSAWRNPLDSLIDCLVLQGKEAEAVMLLQAEWKVARADLGEDAKKRENCWSDFADMFSKCQSYDEAEPLYRELIASRASRLSAENDDVIKPKASLGRLLANWAWADRSRMATTNTLPLQRAREAERLLREVLAIRNKQPDRSPRRLGDTRSRLGGALLSLAVLEPGLPPEEREARLGEAEAEMLAGQDLMIQSKSVDPKYVRHGLERLLRLYEAWDKPEQANLYRAKLKTFGLTETSTKTASNSEASP
jgi:serine/threonine protein kinase/tetratricopeptide (TPR) repeat protein